MIKTISKIACHFQVLFLVFTHGNISGTMNKYIRCLAQDKVSKPAFMLSGCERALSLNVVVFFKFAFISHHVQVEIQFGNLRQYRSECTTRIVQDRGRMRLALIKAGAHAGAVLLSGMRG